MVYCILSCSAPACKGGEVGRGGWVERVGVVLISPAIRSFQIPHPHARWRERGEMRASPEDCAIPHPHAWWRERGEMRASPEDCGIPHPHAWSGKRHRGPPPARAVFCSRRGRTAVGVGVAPRRGAGRLHCRSCRGRLTRAACAPGWVGLGGGMTGHPARRVRQARRRVRVRDARSQIGGTRG